MELFFLLGFGILGALWILSNKASKIPSPAKSGAASKITNPLYMLPESFIVFDLETTGLYPDRHEIIEIAAIKVKRDSEEHEYFQTLVKIDGKIRKKISSLTGINQDMVSRDGVALQTALSEFLAFVGNLQMVAYNADFDRKFLESSLVRIGAQPPNNRYVCALKMARLAWPGRSSYKLMDISGDGGLAVDDSHRALGDCRRALIVYATAARILGRSH